MGMTILGAFASRDAAVMWTDTQATGLRPGVANTFCSKLTINAAAMAIGAGCGWIDLALEASAAVCERTDFDDVVLHVCGALRKSSARHVHKYIAVGASFTGCRYLLAGWSKEAARFVVYDLSAVNFFEPVLATQRLYPEVDAPSLSLPSLETVQRLAGRQASCIPNGVGHLCVATITLGGIVVLPPSEITAVPCLDQDAAEAPVASGLTVVRPCSSGRARSGRASARQPVAA